MDVSVNASYNIAQNIITNAADEREFNSDVVQNALIDGFIDAIPDGGFKTEHGILQSSTKYALKFIRKQQKGEITDPGLIRG